MRFIARLKAAKWRLVAGALVLALTGYISIQYWTPVDPPSSPSQWALFATVDSPDKNSKVEARGAASATPGMEVSIDPKTGQFRKPPARQIPGEMQTSQPPRGEEAEPKVLAKRLEERVNPVVGGGIVANVRLRFRRPLVASKDADGNLVIQHAPQDEDLNGRQ
ncbi:MAG: hypothetical protein HY267_08310 [Deltaproteobacteria bacterium]|nr:hypothetical protein [Deltaproteobacteria bacterium]